MPRPRIGADASILAATALLFVASCASCGRDPTEPTPFRPELRRNGWDDPARVRAYREWKAACGRGSGPAQCLSR